MKTTWQQAIGIDTAHLVKYQQSAEQYFLIHQSILSDLEALLNAAKKDGQAISLISSYRSFDRQQTIWNEKWQGYRPVYSRHGRPLNLLAMSDMEKYKAISLWSALPGLSRHHWGTDIDIFSNHAINQGHQVELVPEEFSKNGVCYALECWLEKHLEKYGFFRPYQKYQQGVSEEPWHISHRQTSQVIIENFPYQQCLQQLRNSDIKAQLFIEGQFEHYKHQYFNNICLINEKEI